MCPRPLSNPYWSAVLAAVSFAGGVHYALAEQPAFNRVAAAAREAVSAWHMDHSDTVRSLLAQRTTGDEKTGVAAGTPGIRGACLVFGGRGAGVTVTDLPPLDLSGEATIAAWIKIRERRPGTRQAIASQREASGDAWCWYSVSTPSDGAAGWNHQLGLDLLGGGASRTHRTTGPTITQGLWYHVAVTLGGGRLRFFVDGVKVLEKPEAGALGSSRGPLLIGNDPQALSPFCGAIDELTITPRSLAEPEVAALYRDELGQERQQAIRQAFLADFPRAPQMPHWILPGHPDRPREGAARAAFLARFPHIPPSADAVRRPWTDYLEPPFWYSKVWTRREADPWPGQAGKPLQLVAAADSLERHKVDANYVCDGSDDDLIIQIALDAVPEGGGKVLLLPGTYVLGNSLQPKDDTELEIQGTLRVAPARVSRLAADCPPGQNRVTVEDAGAFRAGQWVTLMDDHKPDHKGGRKYGECATIQRIDGNTIVLQGEFGTPAWTTWMQSGPRAAKGYRADYSVRARAFLTTSHSAILVRGRSRVFIHGPGQIDGNKAHQSPTAPYRADPRGGEEVLANCGIAIADSSFVTVQKLRIHDANLHNVTLYRSENCEVSGVEASACNDKNILLLNTLRVKLLANQCHDSACEDGICLYFANHSALLAGNRTAGNPRHGIWVNPSCLHETLLPPEALPR